MRFQEVKHPLHQTETLIPKRATNGSAGYDLHLKEDVTLEPGEAKLTFSDVKCQLEPGEVLYLHVRSSIGFKQGIALANGTGVIDSDYYENKDNDGNIGLPLWNYSNKTVTLKATERVAQGVIHSHKADAEDAGERTGGFGSSGR